MYNGVNVDFVKDRFGKPNSAIRFSYGFYQVPSGVYFKGDFTVSVWIKAIGSFYNAPIFDFGNGGSSDNIRFISTSYYYSQSFYMFFKNYESRIDASFTLVLGQWTHWVFTLSDTVGSFYANGLLIVQTNDMFIPRNINRTSNYIGKSNWDWQGNLWADLDDLRIYNRSMSQAEINALFLQQAKKESSNLLGFIKRFINRFVIFN
jgi:hypothetical protein